MEKQLSFFDLIHSKSVETISNEKMKQEVIENQPSHISSLNNQGKELQNDSSSKCRITKIAEGEV